MPLYNVYEYRLCHQMGGVCVEANSPGDALLQVVADPDLIAWGAPDPNDHVLDGHSVQTNEICVDTRASVVESRWMEVSRMGFVGTRASEAEGESCD